METRRVSKGLMGIASAVAVLAIALSVRLPALDKRPMHGDEANQAVRTGLLLEKGVYRYDPKDHHGPVLYFAALPFCRATAQTFAETSEWNFRLVPVAFSCLTLLLMLGLSSSRGGGLFDNREGVLAAALLTALSPPMVYYSRFFIQESMFVTFLTGMLVCAVRYVQVRTGTTCSAWGSTPSDAETVGAARSVEAGCFHEARAAAGYAAGFGAFAGLALATKETVVLSFAAAAVAALAACGFQRLLKAWRTRDALLALGLAALVAVLFYSSFFTYPKGVYDALFSTVQAYITRATAVPEHQHPWNFYLKILFWFKYGRGPVWSEAGLLFPACVAVAAAYWPGREVRVQTRWVRFVAVYTLVLTALYSAIPYKTPWCALTFLHGFILLAGIGIGEMFKRLGAREASGTRRGRVVVYALLLALLLRDKEQTARACFQLPADPRNPYVYAHTGTDAMNLVTAVREASERAQGLDTPIAIAVPTPDTWPLPWYFRAYKQVGYWTRVADIPASFEPAIIVAAADQGDVADERFGQGKRASFYGIRPGVLLNVFVPVKAAGEKRE
jgi:uncharacterized protein (TIGR03663 family)